MNVRSFLLLATVLMVSACMGMGVQAPAPVTRYGAGSGAGSAGVHNVSPGDTLYSISKRYNVPMRDIAIENNIGTPFSLYPGQRLELPPPQEYRVRVGDTLYDISRLFGVSPSEIADMNAIRPPYAVRPGEVLRLPYRTRKTQSTQKPAIIIPPQKPMIGAEAALSSLSAPVSTPSAVSPNSPNSLFLSKPQKITVKTPARSSAKFMRPVQGRVVSSYGAKDSGLHNDGINIEAPRGTSIAAAENGVVVYTGSALKGSGNLVLLRHEDRWMTAYAHMDRIMVARGDVVKRGQSIGTVGSTGSVATPQLHFEVRRGTEAMNPGKYME